MPIISLLSDFGSLYPAQVKGVILGSNADAVFVDIAHDIPAQDICSGAFALMISVPYFPQGSIHMAVVDPGVGTLRRPLIVEAGGHLFVGPDNGLLIPAAHRLSPDIIVREITIADMFLDLSSTFHGRDIFAPVAAHLSRGMAPVDIGPEITDYIGLDFGFPSFLGNMVKGRILFVDGFGNIITNIYADQMLERFGHGDVFTISGLKVPLVNTYSDVKMNEPMVLVGSHGYIEIAVNSGSAFELFQLRSGEILKLNKM